MQSKPAMYVEYKLSSGQSHCTEQVRDKYSRHVSHYNNLRLCSINYFLPRPIHLQKQKQIYFTVSFKWWPSCRARHIKTTQPFPRTSVSPEDIFMLWRCHGSRETIWELVYPLEFHPSRLQSTTSNCKLLLSTIVCCIFFPRFNFICMVDLIYIEIDLQN